MTSSKTSTVPLPARDLAQRLEVARLRRDRAHVPAHGLDDDRGEVAPVRRDDPLDRRHVVVGHDERVSHRALGHARGAGDAEGRDAGPGGDQQRVGVAVVAAVELEDLAPAGEAARDAQRAHGGLGARRDEAHLLDRRHVAHDALGQLHLEGAGRAERGPASGRAADRLQHRGVRVSQDHRPPRADVVDERAAVLVPEPGPFRPGHEEGRSAHGLERPHRARHAPGDDRLRPLEQLLGSRHARSSPQERVRS